MNRAVVLTILVASLTLLPGCIAYEIRDELSATNKQLDELKALRATINDLQQKALSQLEQANMLLVETNGRLGRVTDQLDRVDALLVKTDDQLATLETIDESLVSLDKQLLTVKGLVEALSGVMSLFGSSQSEEPATDEHGNPIEGETPASDQPDGQGEPDEQEGDTDEPAQQGQRDLPNQPRPKD